MEERIFSSWSVLARPAARRGPRRPAAPPRPGAAAALAQGPAGEDDVALWQACHLLLPPGPDRDRAEARLTLLDRDLAAH